MSTILLAGGTGFIGSRLQTMLRERGHTVRLLSRRPKGVDQFAWDPLAGALDETALRGADAVVNLAGAGIADKRWTPARKRLLLESRTKSAALLRDAFQRAGQRPEVYVSASAIGYYGDSDEQLMRENDPPVGSGFLAQTCQVWEQAAGEVAALGIRTVVLRIGIVLDQTGGALHEIVRPLRFGIGAYFGDGRAWYSWIHRDDVCRAIIFALENRQIEGAFNAVAPHPVRNRELVKAAAKARQRPAFLAPAPVFALRLALGEMADAILQSNRVSAEKLTQTGFIFQYPELDAAMAEIFQRR